jgi:nucleotide-binding universal stress UspA family protein
MASGRTILLAVRIGQGSEAPARTAAWLARDLDARVTILNVAVELQTAPAVAAGAGLDIGEVRERMVEDARERAEALGREHLADIPHDVLIVEGDVAHEVANAADRIGAALVVAGSQARSGFRSVILGDTTQAILRRSHCPVVVVPPGVE